MRQSGCFLRLALKGDWSAGRGRGALRTLGAVVAALVEARAALVTRIALAPVAGAVRTVIGVPSASRTALYLEKMPIPGPMIA